jgi:hypothetical protein
MRWLALVLALLFSAIPAFGQTTSVSGTITDQGSQAWAFGTVQFTFRPSNSNPTGPYFQNGVPFNVNTTVPSIPLPLDGAGSFAGLVVPDNNTITPSGSTFTVQVCPAATTPCFSQNLTITGASMNISAQIVPPAIILNLTVPLIAARAYTDSEVTGALPGTDYFNLTDNRLHLCLQTGFPPCTWFVINGGGGTVTSVSSGNFSPLFNVSVANPTTTPALSFTALNAPAGTIFGNPTGSPAPPSFNAPSAFSGIGTVTSFSAGTANPFFTTSVATPATTPALTFNINTQSANCVFAGPTSGGATTPTCRALVGADLPTPTLTTLGGVLSKVAVTHQFFTSLGNTGAFTSAQPTVGDISGLNVTQISTGTNSSVCSTTNVAGNTCTTTVTISPAQPDTGFIPLCMGQGAVQFPFILGTTTQTTTSITVEITNGQGNQAQISTFASLNCAAIHP